MSAETDLRAALIAYAPLIALVPAKRISLDMVTQGFPKPFIVLTKQRDEIVFGLNNSILGRVVSLDIQCVHTDRLHAIQLREQVEAALLAANWPWEQITAGYDPEAGLEVEVVSVNWLS